MKRFIKNIILFMLPVFIMLLSALPLYLMAVSTGEFDSITANIEKQRSNPVSLLGLGYNEQTQYYKLLNVNDYKPKIIALGTSRVMQFEHDFFKESFYNCGGVVGGNYDEYLNFLQNLTYKPDVIILGLDTWVFNRAWNKSRKVYDRFTPIKEIQRSLLISIIRDWFSGKWKLSDLNLYPKNIGFNGRVNDEGFMLDGSYYYGYIYRAPEKQKDYQFADTLHRIRTGTARFEWGEHIDEKTLSLLNKLLHYCKEQGITVIGFLPPFAPTIYTTMYSSGNYGYMNEIKPACEKLFKKYEFSFFDYQNGAELNVGDSFFVDGFHGSEVVYGKIVLDMARKDEEFKKYVDTNRLETLLNNAYNGLVFENPDATAHSK